MNYNATIEEILQENYRLLFTVYSLKFQKQHVIGIIFTFNKQYMKSVYKGDIMACKTKIAIPQTHPIQHFCPQFASYAKMPEIDLCVFLNQTKD